MNRKEKYEAIKSMWSVGQLTAGDYPTQTEFYKALAENRVSGEYGKRIIIVSACGKSYTFTNKNKRS